MLFANQSWTSLEKVSRDIPFILPVAAIEQHGHHLPVGTDTMLLTEIIRRVEASLGDRVLIAPVQWLGNSHHHLDFGGTLSADPRNYLDLLRSLVQNVVMAGFRRIVVINGHGGNDVPAKQALFEMRQELRTRSDILLLMTTYWSLGSQPWEDFPGIHQRDMGHACEWETSMILALHPELVGDYQSAAPVDPGNAFRPGYRAWTTPDRSKPGHIGWPHLATREKGEHLLQCFSQDVTQWLERVIGWDGQSWDG